MFDLADLNTGTEATYALELLHPVTKEPTGLFIEHMSINAPAVQQVARKQSNQVLLKDFQEKRGAKDATPITVEEAERRGVTLLVTASTNWYTIDRDKAGNLDPSTKKDGFPFGKTRLLFSTDEATKLYSDPGYAWARDQLDKSIGDVGNFIGK